MGRGRENRWGKEEAEGVGVDVEDERKGNADVEGEEEGEGADAMIAVPVLDVTETTPAAVPYSRTRSSSRARGCKTENKS